MRSWKNVDDRRSATIDFANFMKDPKNKAIRDSVCADPDEAKRQFAEIGQFSLDGEDKTAIPKSVQFKVYDSQDKARQDSVVLILPSAKGGDPSDATDIWIAAWPPWIGLTP